MFRCVHRASICAAAAEELQPRDAYFRSEADANPISKKDEILRRPESRWRILPYIGGEELNRRSPLRRTKSLKRKAIEAPSSVSARMTRCSCRSTGR